MKSNNDITYIYEKLSSLYPNYSNKKPKAKIYAKAYTSLAYKSYQLADKVKDILFIRTDTRHFAIIADHDDFMDSIVHSKGEDGKTKQQGRVVIGSGFTWNDDQQTPTPTYLSAKHGE